MRHVYLIHCQDRYKIGVSHSPDARSFQVAPGSVVVHTFPSRDAFAVEHALHQRFHAQRKGGEWFELSAADVALVRALARVDDVRDLPLSLRLVPARAVTLSVELPAEVAASLEVTAAALGLAPGELCASLINAHLGEYRLLAREVRRTQG